MDRYLRPTQLTEALAALDAGARTIIAGGTDYYPARVGKPLDEDILDVTALRGLGRIEDTGGAYRIGALITWSDILRADLPPWFDALKGAARELGGVQVQNAGTIAGNLCNASPSADAAPILIGLEAKARIFGQAGERVVELNDFFTGPGKTVLKSDEILTGIEIPNPPPHSAAVYLKQSPRRAMDLAVVGIAVVLSLASNGTVSDIRIVKGAVAPTPIRAV
ncbi:MAG: FAD binding domain-containing protein, partial [Proteobacteria bacterium]|nr:FAD binding domain-containing protein [Pseudomonadota bacterium]